VKFGSFYGVVTFVTLAGIFLWATGWSWPSTDRRQTSIMLTWFLVCGWFAYKVGQHSDVSYWKAVGRVLKGLVMR
jgi:hypothetical protein